MFSEDTQALNRLFPNNLKSKLWSQQFACVNSCIVEVECKKHFYVPIDFSSKCETLLNNKHEERSSSCQQMDNCNFMTFHPNTVYNTNTTVSLLIALKVRRLPKCGNNTFLCLYRISWQSFQRLVKYFTKDIKGTMG